MSADKILRVGLIGAGRMGSYHGENVALRLPSATLLAIADPVPGSAEKLAVKLGVNKFYTDPQELLNDPEIEAVIIATPARFHAELVVKAAKAGKSVFCEKPMAVTLDEAEKAISAAKTAGVALQVGFNRRFEKGFAAAHQEIKEGKIGVPQLLRSTTRDPGNKIPFPIPDYTIFLETLIHDFDTLNYLNPGAKATQVYADADALVLPEHKDEGMLDTSVVNIRYDNGAFATAEASFRAVYGYDIRGEAFGSEGMIQAGNINANSSVRYSSEGISVETARGDVELLHDAYVAELADFVRCVVTGATPLATGEDARDALAIALACIDSVKQAKPIKL